MRRVERLFLAAIALGIVAWVGAQVRRGNELRHYKSSLDVMYRNRAVIELYLRRTGRYPAPGKRLPLTQIATMIGPMGHLLVPSDGWGNAFVSVTSSDGLHHG